MVEKARKEYNDSFSQSKYEEIIEEFNLEFPGQLDYRIAETPVFFDRNLKIKLLIACNSIIDTINSPDYLDKAKNAIPKGMEVPNETTHPEILAFDYGITIDEDGAFAPKLIELQGFPSLFAYQAALGQKYTEKFSINNSLYSPYFNRLNEYSYLEEMGDFLKNGIDSKNCVLLEVKPEQQKTRLDFAITEKYWGIKTVGLEDVIKEGDKLYYIDGEKIQIKRIYNRVILDELHAKFPDLKSEFKFSDPVDVEWVSHPNWYYKISKFTLPFLKGNFVPLSHFLNEVKEIPNDLENYVLKPLYSFAGSGVKIDITKEDIESIKDPQNYLLQEKVNYIPVVRDIRGNLIKVEVRLLYIWPKGALKPKLITNLCRLSKGAMIGVDYNKNFDWVGGSAGFFEKN